VTQQLQLSLLTLVLVWAPNRREGISAFDYASDLGVAMQRANITCLAINNGHLSAGARVALVVLNTPQSIVQAEVLGSTNVCQSQSENDSGINKYEIRVLNAKTLPMSPAIAITGTPRLRVRRGLVTADLDGNNRKEYFRQCTSGEGVHLTVWTGKPLRGRRRWHRYYYLGYDTDPNCTSRDTASNVE
jgi:hypothetical protein